MADKKDQARVAPQSEESSDLNAVNLFLAQLNDVVARLEQNQLQIHEVNQTALGELGARLDRIEANAMKQQHFAEAGPAAITQAVAARADQIAAAVHAYAPALERLDVQMQTLAGDMQVRFDSVIAGLGDHIEPLGRLDAQGQNLAAALESRFAALQSGIDGQVPALQRLDSQAQTLGKGVSTRFDALQGLVSDQIPALQRLDSQAQTLAKDVSARFDALQGLVSGQTPALQRLDAQAQALTASFRDRLDNIEAGLLAPSKDALSRVEQAAGQHFDAVFAALSEIGARLDRLEAAGVKYQTAQDQFAGQVSAAMKRLAGTVRASESPAARPLFEQRFESGAAFAQWVKTHCPDLPKQKGRDADILRFVQDDRKTASLVEALRSALARLAVSRQSVPAGVELVWLLPHDRDVPDAEIEQAFGIIGVVRAIHRLGGKRPFTAVFGVRRSELLVPLLRWTEAAFASVAAAGSAIGSGQQPLPDCMPAIVLPALKPQQARAFAAKAAAVINAYHRGALKDIRECAVIWPQAALADAEPYRPALRELINILPETQWKLSLQWVEGIPAVNESAAILSLAGEAGVAADATVAVRAQMAGAFAAYDDSLTYYPMPFDLRLPHYGASGASSLMCLPRQDDLTLPLAADPFGAQVRALVQRLDLALDRQRRAGFQHSVAQGAMHAGGWERHFIYNWKQPSPFWARACVFDATPEMVARLALLGTGFSQACRAVSASAVATMLAETHAADSLDRHDNRALQVEAHAYLTDRLEPSPDALRMAEWLPEAMGDTLEIGSGFAVLAKRLKGRMASYVGVDLTVEQGKAVASLGGLPVVGDFHELPFSDSRFDTLIADNVIEHALDPVRALREIARLLKPQGRAYFILPLDYLGPDYRNPSHMWKADRASIEAAFETSGLMILRSEITLLPKLGATGSFPSCNQTTSIWEAGRAAPARQATAPGEKSAPSRALR